MTKASDPAVVIVHLDDARAVAVELHRHLNNARNATAHIISQGADDGQ